MWHTIFTIVISLQKHPTNESQFSTFTSNNNKLYLSKSKERNNKKGKITELHEWEKRAKTTKKIIGFPRDWNSFDGCEYYGSIILIHTSGAWSWNTKIMRTIQINGIKSHFVYAFATLCVSLQVFSFFFFSILFRFCEFVAIIEKKQKRKEKKIYFALYLTRSEFIFQHFG